MCPVNPEQSMPEDRQRLLVNWTPAISPSSHLDTIFFSNVFSRSIFIEENNINNMNNINHHTNINIYVYYFVDSAVSG